ncbi:TetR/AcrR family transcriptional regulator [Promicromonospora thailandica]|uniref:Transcriptional regulator, TetR family n=1 Tax=Promicromonospora thailandica TaxID=765201 RepID=A0A9X2G0X3_9MICO|nr:TetR/AcrR family transcriptional regulator [Promicromonospora thailandica]MCP2265027.1 transcriptional regulator, TetR family [Promicromonospora thailandica]
MTSARPYHHGNLRQAVLDRAAEVLRERGAASLSLREVTADIGVSHAAPRRYFADRQALLDALAADGFARLGLRLREAVESAPTFGDQVRAIADVYVAFAVSEANLLELMYAHGRGGDGPLVEARATEAFTPLLDVFRRDQARARRAPGEAERTGTLFLATLQGIAGLASCGVVAADQLDGLVDEAVARYGTGSAAAS